MVIQETSQIKERILSFLKRNGPSLPVHVAKEMNLSILFASAFLSELLSEKKIKISNIRVGSSPVYLISGQEFLLERFSEHLKSKEKEAFLLIQKEKVLKDNEQEPAIKVALRQIRDYALPFKNEKGEIYWRYFKTKESDFKEKKEIREEEIKKIEEKVDLNIFDKEKEKKEIKKKTKRIPQKRNDKFFNRVKDYLSEKSIETLNIESFSKNDLFLRIRKDGKEKLLVALNKKRISEIDILKANKKAVELNLEYVLLSLGEPLKRLKNLIEAIKRLSDIEIIKQ
jgi:hypothetical protein